MTELLDAPAVAGGPSERPDVARVVEDVRIAEGQLERRRHKRCGPSTTTREALRLIAEGADAGSPMTPTELSRALRVSSPAVSSIVSTLARNGLVSMIPNASDRRSKALVPADRRLDVDAVDPLHRSIRSVADDLSDGDAVVVARFLASIRDLIDADCR